MITQNSIRFGSSGRIAGLIVALSLGSAVTNAETIVFEPGNPSSDLNDGTPFIGGTLESTPGAIGIGEVAQAVTGPLIDNPINYTSLAGALTGFANCWAGQSVCPPLPVFLTPIDAASAIKDSMGNADHHWVQPLGSNPNIHYKFDTAVSEVIAVPGIDHDPLPFEALEFIVYGCVDLHDNVGNGGCEEGAIKAVYDDGVDPTDPQPAAQRDYSLIGSSDDFTSVWTFENGPYEYFIVSAGDHIAVLNSPGEFEFDGLAAFDVPVDSCSAGAGGCNPTGALNHVIPQNVVPQVPGETPTFTETVTFLFDSRKTSGNCGSSELTFNLPTGDLVIPSYLCSAQADGEFALLTTDANFDILAGVVGGEMFPETYFNPALFCDDPILGSYPNHQDPTLQDVFTWQPLDLTTTVNKKADEFTIGCGSSRGLTRSKSYFVVGMRIDFGMDFPGNESAVTQKMIDLALFKIGKLDEALEEARPFLKNGDYTKMNRKINNVQQNFAAGKFVKASKTMATFIKFAARAKFTPDESAKINHEGDVLSRANNIKFIIDVKIVPFEQYL